MSGAAFAADRGTHGAGKNAAKPAAPAPAVAGTGEGENPVTGAALKAKPGEFYLPNQPEGETVRVSPQGIDLTYTNATLGYRLTLEAKRAVTWVKRVKTTAADGTVKTEQQIEVYAEGDVIIIRKDLITGSVEKSYCREFYYDFLHHKGVMLDAWFKMYYATRGGGYLYLTAREARELATGDANTTRLKLYGATFTNDDYGRPMLYFKTKSLEIEQKHKQIPGRLRGQTFSRIYMKNLLGMARSAPFFYAPFAAGSTLKHYFLERLRIGSSSRFGFFVMTKWNLQELRAAG